MGFHRMLMKLIWVGVLLSGLMAAAGVAAHQLARPNCSDRCGGVEIPFPFGTTDGCYLNKYFALTCNQSTGEVIYGRNVIVTNISIQGQLEILMYVAHQCFNELGMLPHDNKHFLRVTAFTISSTKNVFVAVGCDTYAYLNGFRNNDPFSMGCMSICKNISNVANHSCSGIGCCQVDIPPGLKNFTLEAYSFKNHTGISSFNPCSYAFVVKQDHFNFSSDYLYTLKDNKTLPMVLDWAIGNETCEFARIKSDYVCGGNSTCYDPGNGYGYRCKCNDGYDGNPYLPLGCQDINECDSINACTANATCTNFLGNFSCSCNDGYEGDGRNVTVCRPVNQSRDSNYVIKTTLGISIGLLALVVGGSCISWALKRRKLLKLKERFFKQNGGLMLQQKLLNHRGSRETDKIFNVEELEKATNNYDKSRVLGQGGYGTVYKGVLPNNKVVAIKKSKISDQRQIEQFINEVIVLTQINHRNVVKLLGCCLETEVPLLVYEFITNGTLSDHIHNKSLASSLSWEKRLKIAAETAGALAYLHFSTSMPIIHRDVKTSNILLDDNYMAKVSDFGASRLVPLDQTQVTTLVQGTFGYLDPEYFYTNQLTEKSDVYSFGVVLAELLTGNEALSFNRPESDRSLALYFVSAIKEDRLLQILEDNIVNEGNIQELKEVAKLAKKCLSIRGEDRPTMKEVAMELEGLTIMVKHPWEKASLHSEETEFFLDSHTRSFDIDVGIGCSSTTRYDSMTNQVLKPLDDGR